IACDPGARGSRRERVGPRCGPERPTSDRRDTARVSGRISGRHTPSTRGHCEGHIPAWDRSAELIPNKHGGRYRNTCGDVRSLAVASLNGELSGGTENGERRTRRQRPLATQRPERVAPSGLVEVQIGECGY